MWLTEKRRRVLTGTLLALGVVLSRLPFIAEHLYEFDSVDFAIATFRFDLAQFTPHPPGYILHVLLGRWIAAILGDINLGFVWLSILLSVGSVLFLWRAAAHLRGERVGVITAVLWMLAPMFWFYGEIATSYVHEAFFASVFLYIGIRSLREGPSASLLYGLLIAFSLSVAARQSSVLFFAPAVIYLLVKARPSKARLSKGLLLFAAITGAWIVILLNESGGLAAYLDAIGREKLYTTQSVLFGNAFSEHFGVLSKLGLFLIVGCFPVLLILLYGLLVFRGECIRFIRTCLASRTGKFIYILIGPPLLFYAAIYFMKAGYLLNMLPAVFLFGGVLLDHIAILHARRTREADPSKVVFTRKLITQSALIGVLIVGNIEILWYTLPLPGKDRERTAYLFSHQTFRESMESRFSGQDDKAAFLLNKVFAYSSSAGVENVDSLHRIVRETIARESPEQARTVIFDTWWQRFSYFYFPDAVCYDIRSYDADTLFSGLRMHNYTFEQLKDTNLVPGNTNVFVVIRHEHPDLKILTDNLDLTKVEAPAWIDIYRVNDAAFILPWKNRVFVKQ